MLTSPSRAVGAAGPTALLGLAHPPSTRYPAATLGHSPLPTPPYTAPSTARRSAVKAWPTAPLDGASGVLGAAAVHPLPPGVAASAMAAAPGLLALGSDDGRLQLLASARLGSSSALSSAVQLGDEEGALLACGMLGRGGGGAAGGSGGGGGGEHGSVLLYSTEAPAP